MVEFHPSKIFNVNCLLRQGGYTGSIPVIRIRCIMEEEHYTITSGKLYFVGLLVTTLIIMIIIFTFLNYFEVKNDESFDASCRSCAQQYNLTCTEQPFYNKNNIFRDSNTTRLNCDNDIRMLHDYRICLEESKYNHHI